MPQSEKKRIFISYHEKDESYKKKFLKMMKQYVKYKSIPRTIGGDKKIKTEEIYRQIREKQIRDAVVTVVLIGPCTWQRKFVDWEIGASLNHTKSNPRCGLLGILLPNHPDYKKKNSKWNCRLIPPRLADNYVEEFPYVKIYKWPDQSRSYDVYRWIQKASKRTDNKCNNTRRLFAKSRTKQNCLKGWVN